MKRSIGVCVHGLRTWMGAVGLKGFEPLAIRLAIAFLALFAWTSEASAAIGIPVPIGNNGYSTPDGSAYILDFPVTVTPAVAVNNTGVHTFFSLQNLSHPLLYT